MIRVTLRQLRTQGVLALGGLVAVAVVVLLTRGHLIHLYDTSVATCAARGDCDTVTHLFLNTDRALRLWLGLLVVVVPGLIGVFWGSTLVTREIEAGTFRLAWTQSITRTRWLAVKLAVVGLAAVIAAGLLSLLVTWWASLLDRVGMSRFSTFDARGVVPIGHALFGFVLGVTAGVVIRRVLPAMATTLVAFLTARLSFVHWIRPNLIAPLHRILPLGADGMGFGSTNGGPMTLFPQSPDIPNGWIYSTRIVDRAGQGLTSQEVTRACPAVAAPHPSPAGGGGPRRTEVPRGAVDDLHNCVTKLAVHYHELVTYQPANRYWALQWSELTCFLGASIVLAGVSIWWVRTRLR